MANSAADRFLSTFPPCGRNVPGEWTNVKTMALVGRDIPSYTLFRREHGEASFGNGLLRFVGGQGLNATRWNGIAGWRTTWPDQPYLAVFAYDWLARQYAFDRQRVTGDEPLVTMLDPADGAVLDTDFTFEGFLEWLAGPDGDGGLSTPLYTAWLALGGTPPNERQCVCFKHPLRLGGKQVPENLELGDMEVQLSILHQINASIARARGKK
jgi:hypothetical protein